VIWKLSVVFRALRFVACHRASLSRIVGIVKPTRQFRVVPVELYLPSTHQLGQHQCVAYARYTNLGALDLKHIAEVPEWQRERSNIRSASWLLRRLKERSHCRTVIKNTCTYLKDTKICVMRNSTKASPETGRISEVGSDIGSELAPCNSHPVE
jgi:hypothetical protein